MKKINLEIKTYPNFILRKKAKPIKNITNQERELLSKMAQAMYEHNGIGLAANQAGIDKAMLVADPGNCLYKLINPKIVKRQGISFMDEGCLSVPGICLNIKRAGTVTVKAQDENGKPITIEAQGLLSHILQHEIDHLRGKLIIDYASFLERMRIKRSLKKLGRENEGMSKSKKESQPL